MTAATIPLQPLQPSSHMSSVQSYDIFSKYGDACCAKLDEDAMVDVFQQDESQTKITVSWSNGQRSCGDE